MAGKKRHRFIRVGRAVTRRRILRRDETDIPG